MRAIKFRVWNPVSKMMFCPDGLDLGRKALLLIDRDPWRVAVLDRWTTKDGYKLMQYTGLEDKNGKEIYEGDIIEWTIWPDLDDGYSFDTKRIRDVVVFKHGSFSLEKRMELLISLEPTREPEVVGNIHENPELVKQD